MANNELEPLLNELCLNIKSFLDENSDVTKEHLAEFLRNSAQLISDMSTDTLNSYNTDKYILSDEYKNIAKECLTHYANTSSKISKLSVEHQETLAKCDATHIDLPKITSKFNEIQEHMVDEVSKANSIISQLSSQIKELEEKSNLDPLTKIYNRGALNTYLSEMCENANDRYETHLLAIDIDDFKAINDKYGHIAGDKILIYIARILKKTLRDGDKVFRFGGEEFIVVLNRIKENQCMDIAHRLLKLVSDNKLIYKGDNIGVTVSIGSTKLKVGDTPDAFITRADKALYRSKQSGKNKLSTEPI
ncbi:GGDEF domain-containing protein [Sulfurimonas sp.]|uniref:GGDEF domain-containing protein n=1 Tax=Sulfurimonas sp. TaxID=2022749 RepID=UPI0035691F0A